jgi:5-formyltetrahydrofolate cyclo-ligase
MKFDLNDEYALRVMVIPAVAFTSQGFRLGRGGGFYDRYLAEWKSVRPVCIGVGYDFQLLEDLPHEPHDQKLDWIFTPSHSIQIL